MRIEKDKEIIFSSDEEKRKILQGAKIINITPRKVTIILPNRIKAEIIAHTENEAYDLWIRSSYFFSSSEEGWYMLQNAKIIDVTTKEISLELPNGEKVEIIPHVYSGIYKLRIKKI